MARHVTRDVVDRTTLLQVRVHAKVGMPLHGTCGHHHHRLGCGQGEYRQVTGPKCGVRHRGRGESGGSGAAPRCHPRGRHPWERPLASPRGDASAATRRDPAGCLWESPGTTRMPVIIVPPRRCVVLCGLPTGLEGPSRPRGRDGASPLRRPCRRHAAPWGSWSAAAARRPRPAGTTPPPAGRSCAQPATWPTRSTSLLAPVTRGGNNRPPSGR